MGIMLVDAVLLFEIDGVDVDVVHARLSAAGEAIVHDATWNVRWKKMLSEAVCGEFKKAQRFVWFDLFCQSTSIRAHLTSASGAVLLCACPRPSSHASSRLYESISGQCHHSTFCLLVILAPMVQRISHARLLLGVHLSAPR
jgi:hypothetical protein